jgi:hypothetical protein
MPLADDGPSAEACDAITSRLTRRLAGTCGREEPLAILRAADATRQPDLLPLRYGRMLRTPFTFYRGSAGVAAADRAHLRQASTYSGAHLMNLRLRYRGQDHRHRFREHGGN